MSLEHYQIWNASNIVYVTRSCLQFTKKFHIHWWIGIIFYIHIISEFLYFTCYMRTSVFFMWLACYLCCTLYSTGNKECIRRMVVWRKLGYVNFVEIFWCVQCWSYLINDVNLCLLVKLVFVDHWQNVTNCPHKCFVKVFKLICWFTVFIR